NRIMLVCDSSLSRVEAPVVAVGRLFAWCTLLENHYPCYTMQYANKGMIASESNVTQTGV
ncbi:MAG TPA: hypothetical protein PKE45_05420, partial [Caldilineaceae bacterium]|nr:hypothetical protein [Caldilineaceae bacterium]